MARCRSLVKSPLGRDWPRQPGNFLNTMKTTKKQTQCQRLLAYLKKNRKGITTMEAFQHLGICCLHKRIGELQTCPEHWFTGKPPASPYHVDVIRITRTRERTPGGATVTRYKLAK